MYHANAIAYDQLNGICAGCGKNDRMILCAHINAVIESPVPAIDKMGTIM